VLADPFVAPHGAQPHHERHGVHRRSDQRFPNANGHIPFECATIAEVLGERGWNTYMLGKWHLCPADEMNLASTKRNWPVGRGFERYYGFLGGETNQWHPDLVYDNHPVAHSPATSRSSARA
jgi:arylsulfatase A-like enzyme